MLDQLKKMMDAEGITQSDLARRMHKTRTIVARWFTFERSPGVSGLVEAADAMDADWVLVKRKAKKASRTPSAK